MLTRGQKAAQTLKANDPEWFAKLGGKGGRAPHSKPRGFARNRSLAVAAGKKGKRKHVVKENKV